MATRAGRCSGRANSRISMFSEVLLMLISRPTRKKQAMAEAGLATKGETRQRSTPATAGDQRPVGTGAIAPDAREHIAKKTTKHLGLDKMTEKVLRQLEHGAKTQGEEGKHDDVGLAK